MPTIPVYRERLQAGASTALPRAEAPRVLDAAAPILEGVSRELAMTADVADRQARQNEAAFRAGALGKARLDLTQMEIDAEQTMQPGGAGYVDGVRGSFTKYRDGVLAKAPSGRARAELEADFAQLEAGLVGSATRTEATARVQWRASQFQEASGAAANAVFLDPAQLPAALADQEKALAALDLPEPVRVKLRAELQSGLGEAAALSMIEKDPGRAASWLQSDDPGVGGLSIPRRAQLLNQAQNETKRREAEAKARAAAAAAERNAAARYEVDAAQRLLDAGVPVKDIDRVRKLAAGTPYADALAKSEQLAGERAEFARLPQGEKERRLQALMSGAGTGDVARLGMMTKEVEAGQRAADAAQRAAEAARREQEAAVRARMQDAKPRVEAALAMMSDGKLPSDLDEVRDLAAGTPYAELLQEGAGRLGRREAFTREDVRDKLHALQVASDQAGTKDLPELEMMRKVVAADAEAIKAGTTLERASDLGVIALQPLDLMGNPADQAASIGRRVQQAAAAAEHFGIEPRYLTGAEVDQLQQRFKAGGEDERRALLGALTQGFGDKAPAVLAEIAGKDPDIATLGRLAAEGSDAATIEDALVGSGVDAQSVAMGTAVERATAIDATLGAAFGPELAGVRDSVVRTAEQIYRARKLRSGDTASFDADLFAGALKEAAGQRSRGDDRAGGPGMFNGQALILPNDMTQDELGDLVETMHADEWTEAGGGAPLDAEGKPIPPEILADATLETVAPGQYLVKLGEGAYAAGRGQGGYYVLDTRKAAEARARRAAHREAARPAAPPVPSREAAARPASGAGPTQPDTGTASAWIDPLSGLSVGGAP